MLLPSLLLALAGPAFAAPPVRTVPPSVLAEVRMLENRFDVALAQDCDAERCFSKGCAYVDHAVIDRPATTSLPGLAADKGPGSGPSQEFLTQAQCTFAFEDNVDARDAAALARRLGLKLSKAWTAVSVDHEKLQPVPDYLGERPEDEPEAVDDAPVEDTPEEVVEEPEVPDPQRELWMALLPHFWWMVGIGLLTFALSLLLWAWRRVGQASMEERMLLAEIERGGAVEPEDAEPGASDAPNEDLAFVARQSMLWQSRLDRVDAGESDAELEALTGALLRSGDHTLLAKAALRFPALPSVFPEGGSYAAAKIELADFLRDVDPDELPNDADFFRVWNRHALSATLTSQRDAEVVRSLRDEFGAAGIAGLMGEMPARPGALLFALTPAQEQAELVRLLPEPKATELGGMLLRSNRLDPIEAAWLFEAVAATREGRRLPADPPQRVTDRGTPLEAAGALAVLMERLSTPVRAELFASALRPFSGVAPAWWRGVLTSDMLLALSTEGRADVMLGVDVQALAAWLSTIDAAAQQALLAGAPDALVLSVRASSQFPSARRQLALARLGREALAPAFQEQLVREGLRFEQILTNNSGGNA